MTKFYTFSKEINFDSCKKDKLDRKYQNLRDFKKGNCQQRNLTQRLESNGNNDTTKDLANTKYTFKSRISPPSHLISMKSTDNGFIDAIKSKNSPHFARKESILSTNGYNQTFLAKRGTMNPNFLRTTRANKIFRAQRGTPKLNKQKGVQCSKTFLRAAQAQKGTIVQ